MDVLTITWEVLMLQAANPAPSLWHGIVPPQLVYARRRYLGVVLQPPNENPGSWTGAGKAIYDPDNKRFLLSTRPRKADEGVRGYAAQIWESPDGEHYSLLTSIEKPWFEKEIGHAVQSIEGTQLLKDPLTGHWHIYVSIDHSEEFVWGGLYWETLLITAPDLTGPWTNRGWVLRRDRGFDAFQSRDSSIDIVDGTWMCLYKAMDGTRIRRPALATSQDGISWKKHGTFTIEGRDEHAFLAGTIFAGTSGPVFMGIEKIYSQQIMETRTDIYADKFKITHGGGPLPSFAAYNLDVRNMNLELIFRGPWIPLSPIEHKEHPLLGYATMVYDPLKNRMLLYAQALDATLTQRPGINETVERVICYESPLS